MTIEQERIILDNQKLIGFVIKKLHLGFRFDELKDIGMIGLIKGVKSFDESKGYKPSTYLYQCIRNEIGNFLRHEQTSSCSNGLPTISLDEVISEDNNLTLKDIIKDKNIDIENDLMNKELICKVYEQINNFKERDKEIICHYFGVLGFEHLKQKQLSKKFNISQTQVSRIINKALKKIKKELQDYDRK